MMDHEVEQQTNPLYGRGTFYVRYKIMSSDRTWRVGTCSCMGWVARGQWQYSVCDILSGMHMMRVDEREIRQYLLLD